MATPGIGDISADSLFEPAGFHQSLSSSSIDTGDPVYSNPSNSRNGVMEKFLVSGLSPRRLD